MTKLDMWHGVKTRLNIDSPLRAGWACCRQHIWGPGLWNANTKTPVRMTEFSELYRHQVEHTSQCLQLVISSTSSLAATSSEQCACACVQSAWRWRCSAVDQWMWTCELLSSVFLNSWKHPEQTAGFGSTCAGSRHTHTHWMNQCAHRCLPPGNNKEPLSHAGS